MNRTPSLGSLLLCAALTACAAKPQVVKAPAPPPPAAPAPARALVKAPPPANVPETPVPELKPGTEPPGSAAPDTGTTMQETASPPGETAEPAAPAMAPSANPPAGQALSAQQPSAQQLSAQPPSSQAPSSQAPSTQTAAMSQDTGYGSPANAPENDPRRFTGISDTDATRLLGPPAEKKDTPPSRIWTYRSATCDFKLFFYPEVGGNGYRALTSQFGNPNLTEAEKRACVASLLKVHAG
jgi:hypothetical protein